MKKIVHVKVTQDHIRNGVPTAARRCPVALAIRQALAYDGDIAVVPGCDGVGWDPYWRFATDDKEGRSGRDRPLPRVVDDWVHAYDGGQRVEPFEFDLEVAA